MGAPKAPAKRESGRQTLREPDSYPGPPPETAEERRVKAQRALREQEWALGMQAWTTTEFGLESEENTYVPQPLGGMVSLIQCLLCATCRIPALRFCYCCFWNVAINFIIRATSTGGA